MPNDRDAVQGNYFLQYMEGNRFFDLVRWGIADTYINAYLATESTKKAYLRTAYSLGLYKQNPGY